MSTVLVVGSGGREHALAWKLSLSKHVSRVLVAPGNDGFPKEWGRLEFTDNLEQLAKLAKNEGVELAVIGPDQLLADGIVDCFESYGILTFGPSQKAAQIEASKTYAKKLMQKIQVPTAEFEVFENKEAAKKWVSLSHWSGWVIKADGLALGKGVKVCSTKNEALMAVEAFYKISHRLVIEKCLSGDELSFMAFCDGNRACGLEPARDYKRLQDGNLGPMTGGMGAFSPVPGLPENLNERVLKEVFEPVLKELSCIGTPFKGLLYAGLMFDLETQKFWVLEFNARFGDPETQVLLPRMQGDLFEWCQSSAKGDLSQFPSRVPMSDEKAVYVVAASPGYPDHPKKGLPISGLGQENSNFLPPYFFPPYFFSGVKLLDNRLVTHGGRVLGALGMGKNFKLARETAYDHINKIRFEGIQFRKDIAENLNT